jgi:hypothetical protein
MDTPPKPQSPSRLPIVLLTAGLVLCAFGAAAFAHRAHRFKFQLALANSNLAAAQADLASAKSDLSSAQAQILQLQAKLDTATATSTRLQAQMQQLARMFGQQRQFGRSHRLPVFAGFARAPAAPGSPPTPAFKLRVRSLVVGPLQISVKSSGSQPPKTASYMISRFWTDPDVFKPGDKIEISSEGYAPMRLTVPALPPLPALGKMNH